MLQELATIVIPYKKCLSYQVCRALHVMHNYPSGPLIHCDVKPGKKGERERVRETDRERESERDRERERERDNLSIKDINLFLYKYNLASGWVLYL